MRSFFSDFNGMILDNYLYSILKLIKIFWDLEINKKSRKAKVPKDKQLIVTIVGECGRTLLLEVVVALQPATKSIKGLTSFANPESDGVDCSTHRSHLYSTQRIRSFYSLSSSLEVNIVTSSEKASVMRKRARMGRNGGRCKHQNPNCDSE